MTTKQLLVLKETSLKVKLSRACVTHVPRPAPGGGVAGAGQGGLRISARSARVSAHVSRARPASAAPGGARVGSARGLAGDRASSTSSARRSAHGHTTGDRCGRGTMRPAGFNSRSLKSGRKRKVLIDGLSLSPPEPLGVSEFQTHQCTRLDEARVLELLGFG